LALAALATVAAGCFGNSSSGGSSGSPDSGVEDASASGSDAASGASDGAAPSGDGASSHDATAGDGGCVAPANLPLVAPTYDDAGAPPAQSGGTLVSGTYDVTSVTFYETTCKTEAAAMVGEQVVLSIGYSSATDATGTESHVAEASLDGGAPEVTCQSTALEVSGSAIGNAAKTSSLEGQFTVTSNGFTLVTTNTNTDDAVTCQVLYTLAKQ
jgi:hypothetical protein